MRMLEPDGAGALAQVQLYLSVAEAQEFSTELSRLLSNPEASEHFHVISRDGGVEISVSIVTRAKLASGGYAADELKLFDGWRP